jgi:hypothetical protein
MSAVCMPVLAVVFDCFQVDLYPENPHFHVGYVDCQVLWFVSYERLGCVMITGCPL